MQTQADMYSALPTSTGNELIPFTPQQPSPAFFGQATMNPAFMSMAMPMAPMVCSFPLLLMGGPFSVFATLILPCFTLRYPLFTGRYADYADR